MKKLLALVLALVFALSLTAMAEEPAVMTYADYAAADVDSPVVVDTYVQAKQSWWDNKATVYTQDADGAYFCYDMACSEEDYALGTDALIDHQNQFVSFTGMTVEAYDETGAAFAYKNEADKTDDLYFKVSYNGQTYDFCVEYYLCGSDTDVYKAVENLKVGDVVDMQGFLYWYEGANPHITSVTVK